MLLDQVGQSRVRPGVPLLVDFVDQPGADFFGLGFRVRPWLDELLQVLALLVTVS
ncbi:hypothetical protein [Amycolatopsis sp. H20-H5]|uniref:hypothetical protein n=1 Tax=Amycolatopsis sp. H20-H5 TaxID=3046309 RepID=UPI002DB6C96F|nr:hypothetical protein [Amycolatopsis sp. H20-H5]MEC3974973.1 hypothetical protein [Amycolatopsis sp. H20-H5]